ncbi:MAG TPA: DEAD/DEAH box helicase [Lysobacter sp.]
MTIESPAFQALGLPPAILRALAEKNYATPTPIQQQAIPPVLAGRDVLGGAQTGTGKTAAFSLPLLARLAGVTPPSGPRKPRALVLVPTRELAVQVNESLRGYGRHLRMHTGMIFGGVGMGPQVDLLRRGVDILVATPGRLIDHLERGSVKLDAIEILVLDEADRMLDMGFLPAIKRIVAKVPAKRQTLLFSATFEPRIRGLAMEFLRNPAEVEVAARNTVASTIEHIAHPVDNSRKRELLTHLLATRFQERVLVFGKTKHGCNRLAEQLEESGIKASAIHGNKSQGQRQKALNEFKTGKCRVLVATDVAARGLDIPELPLVINYDLPTVAEDYVHRIGRTGRNGATGEAISLVAIDEGGLLSQVQKLLGKNVRQVIVEGFEPSQALRMDAKPAVGKRSGRPAARPHGKPAARGGHAQAPKPRQGARPQQRRSSSR